MYMLLSTCPAINVNSISGFVQIYSTVGDLVPIWRRKMLLKTCATSFLPYKALKTQINTPSLCI